jgi:hypothetical protein
MMLESEAKVHRDAPVRARDKGGVAQELMAHAAKVPRWRSGVNKRRNRVEHEHFVG